MPPFSKAILTLVDYLLRRIASLFNEKDRKNQVKRAKGNGGSYFFLVPKARFQFKIQPLNNSCRTSK
jgi:hypothetical protein